jgi:hypothetical protein
VEDAGLVAVDAPAVAAPGLDVIGRETCDPP